MTYTSFISASQNLLLMYDLLSQDYCFDHSALNIFLCLIIDIILCLLTKLLSVLLSIYPSSENYLIPVVQHILHLCCDFQLVVECPSVMTSTNTQTSVKTLFEQVAGIDLSRRYLNRWQV